eukprot:10633104-Karenia_brevis.AAC.1
MYERDEFATLKLVGELIAKVVAPYYSWTLFGILFWDPIFGVTFWTMCRDMRSLAEPWADKEGQEGIEKKRRIWCT